MVMDGVMYVTGAKLICALDASTGRSFGARRATPASRCPRAASPSSSNSGPAAASLRRRSARPTAARPRPAWPAATGPNRGVAVVGNRVIFTSDDGYLYRGQPADRRRHVDGAADRPEIRRPLLCDACASGDRRSGDLRRVGRGFLDARFPGRVQGDDGRACLAFLDRARARRPLPPRPGRARTWPPAAPRPG